MIYYYSVYDYVACMYGKTIGEIGICRESSEAAAKQMHVSHTPPASNAQTPSQAR